VRVAELTAAEVEEWDRLEARQRPGIDRTSCLHCIARSGTQCTALGVTHVPLEIKHRCAHYRTRRPS
jgi:hypothetical protein